jgi:hypothetical protein
MLSVERLVAVAAFAVGCGSDGGGSAPEATGGTASVDCTHAAVGSWVGVGRQDALTMSRDGSFSFSGTDGCVNGGAFECPRAGSTSGTMRVTVYASTGGTCLAVGEYTCAFSASGNALSYDCTGTGVLQYQRQ